MSESVQVWIDGKYYPKEQASISVFDHGLLYGDGVFEGIRVYSGRILKLASHLDRLYESAAAITLDVGMPANEMQAVVRETIARNKISDGYIRLIVTRGIGPLGVNPKQCPTPSIIVIADHLDVYPASHYEKGISLVTASVVQKHPATLSPRVKSLNYLPNMLAKLEALRAGADEAVLLNQQGFVTECVGENIFAVHQHGDATIVSTPPVEAGILKGITRGIAIGICSELGFAATESNFTRHDLLVADEIFLTGTGAEIVPVKSYDGKEISGGTPGGVTKKVMERYRELLLEAPED